MTDNRSERRKLYIRNLKQHLRDEAIKKDYPTRYERIAFPAAARDAYNTRFKPSD